MVKLSSPTFSLVEVISVRNFLFPSLFLFDRVSHERLQTMESIPSISEVTGICTLHLVEILAPEVRLSLRVNLVLVLSNPFLQPSSVLTWMKSTCAPPWIRILLYCFSIDWQGPFDGSCRSLIDPDGKIMDSTGVSFHIIGSCVVIYDRSRPLMCLVMWKSMLLVCEMHTTLFFIVMDCCTFSFVVLFFVFSHFQLAIPLITDLV